MNKIFIPHQFITLNKYINAERKNKFAAAKIKKEETEFVYWTCKGLKIETPCKLKFSWFVKDKRSDPDNIAFAKKFILDGFIKANVIPNDNMQHIIGFVDEFVVNKENIGVEIEVIE